MVPKEEESEDIERLEPPSDQAPTKIDLTPPEEGDDDDDAPPVAAKGAGDKMERDVTTGKWTQKKQERQRDFKEKKAWQVEKDAMERRMSDERAAYERRFAEVEARVARSAPGAKQEVDPHEAKLADVNAQIDTELELLAKDEKRTYERYNNLRLEQYKVVAKQEAALAVKAAGIINANNNRQGPYEARRPIIESEFPWTADPNFKELSGRAFAYKQYLVGFQGRPDTLDTDREALAHAQAEFGGQYGLRVAARPTQQQRDGYARPGPGAAAGPRDSRPRSIEIPASMSIESAGLSREALAAALRDVE